MNLSRICFLMPLAITTGCIQSHRATPVVVYTPTAAVVPATVAAPPPTVVYQPTPTSDRPEARVYVAPSPPPGVAGTDVAVAESISQVLKDDPALAGASENVLVTVEHGTVCLRGTVPSEHFKDEISERVKKVPGVDRVENRLGVEGER